MIREKFNSAISEVFAWRQKRRRRSWPGFDEERRESGIGINSEVRIKGEKTIYIVEEIDGGNFHLRPKGGGKIKKVGIGALEVVEE